ncbi:hypothetical protein [Beggiatoa leptomitoformis]|uniref:Uncharacterized protein n=1 Tax=Beggiatoa leptomitoformis TaxID=288004 RepID=A0A650GRJ1_9GAMM|nr:hypothetical protein [Beggiatoa leptomitoformis]QGX03642.1 hypothetical protein AL038_18830 [Beggiatoa leptomitoformis]QGX04077.1 hypothetical protein BLE401_18595 [Beggiatoa leptomitoformis]
MMIKSLLSMVFIAALLTSATTFAQTSVTGMIATDTQVIACGDVDKKDPE